MPKLNPGITKQNLPNELADYMARIDRDEKTKKKPEKNQARPPIFQDYSSEVDTALQIEHDSFEYNGPSRSKNTTNSYTKFLQSLILFGLIIETANQVIPAAAAMPAEQSKATDGKFKKKKESNSKSLDVNKGTIKPRVEFNEIPKKSAEASKDSILHKAQQQLSVEDTLLHNAVERSALDLIARTIKNGANINVKNKDGYTPLEVAIRNNNRPSLAFLLGLGANPNITILVEGKQLPPLHYTAINPEMYSLTKELLMHSVIHPDNFSEEGITPLMLAVLKGNLAAVTLLLQFGANPRVPSADKNVKALDFAAKAHRNKVEITTLLNLFLKITADVRISPQIEVVMSPEEAQQLLCIFASQDKYYDELSWLLKNQKLNVNQIDAYGSTAMHYAASINKGSRVLELLIQYNGDINARNKEGNTPLMEAALFDNELLCLELLSYGADLNVKNAANFTAKAIAQGFQNRSCQSIIESFEKVQNYINNKHYRHALEYIRSLPVILKNNLALKNHLAFIQLKIICLEGLGRYESAIREIHNSLSTYPKHFALHLMAGKVFLKTYQYKDALTHFNAAITLNPSHVEAGSYIPILNFLTNEYYTVKYHKKITLNDFLASSPLPYLKFVDYKKVADVSEDTFPFMYGSGLSQQQAEDLKKQFDLMISKSNMGLNDEAITICERILNQLHNYESYPYFSITFSSLYYHQGIFKKNKGDLDGAIEALKICNGVSGKNFYNMLMLGNMLFEKNRDSEALEVFIQALGDVSKNWEKMIENLLEKSIPEVQEANDNFNKLLLRIPKNTIEQIEKPLDTVILGLIQINSHFNSVKKFSIANELLKTIKLLFDNFDQNKMFEKPEAIENKIIEAVLKKQRTITEENSYTKWTVAIGVLIFAILWRFTASSKRTDETKKTYLLTKEHLSLILKDLIDDIETKQDHYIVRLQNGSFIQETEQAQIKILYTLEQLYVTIQEVLQHYFFQIVENKNTTLRINKNIEVNITSEIAATINKDIKKVLFNKYQTELKREKLYDNIQSQLAVLNNIGEEKLILEKSLENLKTELQLYPENIQGIHKEKKTEALYKKYSAFRLAISNKISAIESEIQDLEKILSDITPYQIQFKVNLNRLSDKNNSLELMEIIYSTAIKDEAYKNLVQRIGAKKNELQKFKTDFRYNIDTQFAIYNEAKEKYLKGTQEIKSKERKHQANQVPDKAIVNQTINSNTPENEQGEALDLAADDEIEIQQADNINKTTNNIDQTTKPNFTDQNNNNNTSNQNLPSLTMIYKKNKDQNTAEFNLAPENKSYFDTIDVICKELTMLEDAKQSYLRSDITGVEVEAKLCQIIFKMVQICEISAKILTTMAVNQKSSSTKQLLTDLSKEVRKIRNFYRHEVRKYIHKVTPTHEIVQKIQYYSKDFANDINKFLIAMGTADEMDVKKNISNIRHRIINIKEKLQDLKDSQLKDLKNNDYPEMLDLEYYFIVSLSKEIGAYQKENDPDYIESMSCSLALLGEAIWEFKNQNKNKEAWKKFIEVTKPFSENTQNNIKAVLSDDEKEYFIKLTSQPLLSILLKVPDKADAILAILNPQDITTLCLEFFTQLGKGTLGKIDGKTLKNIVEHISAKMEVAIEELNRHSGYNIFSIRFLPPPPNNNNNNNDNNEMKVEENTEFQTKLGFKPGKQEE